MDVSPLTRARPDLRQRRYRQTEEQEEMGEGPEEAPQPSFAMSIGDVTAAVGKADITTATWLALRSAKGTDRS